MVTIVIVDVKDPDNPCCHSLITFKSSMSLMKQTHRQYQMWYIDLRSSRSQVKREWEGGRKRRYLIYASTCSLIDDYGHAVKRIKATAYFIISHHPSCRLFDNGWCKITILSRICFYGKRSIRNQGPTGIPLITLHCILKSSTGSLGYIDTLWSLGKCHCNQLSLY